MPSTVSDIVGPYMLQEEEKEKEVRKGRMKRRKDRRREGGKKEKGRKEWEKNTIIHIKATSMHWTKKIGHICC